MVVIVIVVMPVVMVMIVVMTVVVVMVMAVVVFGHGGEVYAGRGVLCREACKNPVCVEQRAPIWLPADLHEVA